jgi:hypothetical protein
MLRQSEGSLPHSQQPTVVRTDTPISEALHSISQYNSLRQEAVTPSRKPLVGGPPPIGFPSLFYSTYLQLPFKSAGRRLVLHDAVSLGQYFPTFRRSQGCHLQDHIPGDLNLHLPRTSSHFFMVKKTGLITVQLHTLSLSLSLSLSPTALQPGVGLGLLQEFPPSLPV